MTEAVDTTIWRLRVCESLSPLLAFDDSMLWRELPRRAREEFVAAAMEALPKYMAARGAGWPAHACAGDFRCGGVTQAGASDRQEPVQRSAVPRPRRPSPP